MSKYRPTTRIVPIQIAIGFFIVLAILTIFATWTERMMVPEVLFSPPVVGENGYTLPLSALHEDNGEPFVIALQNMDPNQSESTWMAVYVDIEQVQIQEDGTFAFRTTYPPLDFIHYSSRPLRDKEMVDPIVYTEG